MSEDIYVLEESSSEYSTSSEDEEQEIIQNTEFMNNTNITEYINNRNNLFTKDIEKHSIMVDTKNICHCSDKHSFTFNLDGVSTHNNTGGLGLYKNVIGFRLLKATIQNIHYTVHDGNYTFIFKEGSNAFTITLTTKFYESESDIASELQTKMNAVSGYIGTATVTYDNNTLKYTIASTTGIELLFAQSTEAGSSIYRLLGFNNEDKTGSTTYTSDNIADASIHYIDLVVNEIPYMACKKNPKGKSLIDRIPIDVGFGSLVNYKAPITDYFSQNYFYPMSLDKLTIDLFQDSHNIPYYNENADHFFEFEITMLKNTKLSN